MRDGYGLTVAGRDLKDLFRAHAAGDELAFRRAANSLISEEESRSHVALARDLRKILVGGDGVAVATDIIRLPDPPTDRDGGWPLAEVRRPDRYFSDLVLVGRTEGQLREVAEEFRRRRELLEAGVPLRRRVLLYGPPGTGKTTAAEGLAAELGLPLVVVRLDSLISSYLGETASNLRRVIDYAGTGQFVVVFDEFDAIGRDRDDPQEHGELKRVVNAFLQMIESYCGPSLLLAATNHEKLLDTALWRRFDDVVEFRRPTVHQIRRLLRLRLSTFPHRQARIEEVATRLRGLPHAAVEAAVFDAARNRVLSGRSHVTGKDLLESADRVKQRPW